MSDYNERNNNLNDDESIESLLEQSKLLQAKIDRKRAQEKESVIQDIKSKIAIYGITAFDLGFSEPTKEKAPRKPRGKVAIKYDDGKGNTWTGRGNRPKWAKGLTDEQLEDYRVSSQKVTAISE